MKLRKHEVMKFIKYSWIVFTEIVAVDSVRETV